MKLVLHPLDRSLYDFSNSEDRKKYNKDRYSLNKESYYKKHNKSYYEKNKEHLKKKSNDRKRLIREFNRLACISLE